MIPYVPHQNYQIQVYIEKKWDTYEGMNEEIYYYDLSSTDVWKEDKIIIFILNNMMMKDLRKNNF